MYLDIRKLATYRDSDSVWLRLRTAPTPWLVIIEGYGVTGNQQNMLASRVWFNDLETKLATQMDDLVGRDRYILGYRKSEYMISRVLVSCK